VTNVDLCATWAVVPWRCLSGRVAGVHDFQLSNPFAGFQGHNVQERQLTPNDDTHLSHRNTQRMQLPTLPPFFS